MSTKRIADAAGILGFFWEKFDADKASDDELYFLGNATENACTLSRNTADCLLGVAAHIGDEHDAGREVKRINGVDLQVLLANIADTMLICGELAFIGSEASYVASKRAEAKSKSSRAERAKQSERDE